MAAPSLRTTLFEFLQGHALGCRYPSPTMLDRLEAALPDPEAAEDLARTLMDRMSEERFPSPGMLDRVMSLIDKTG